MEKVKSKGYRAGNGVKRKRKYDGSRWTPKNYEKSTIRIE